MARVVLDEGFEGDVTEAARRGVLAAASVVVAKAKKNLSRPGAPTSKTGRASLRRGLALLESAGNSFRDLRASAAQSGAARNDIWQALRLRSSNKRSGLNASDLVDPPGGFPRLRTGTLRRSIDLEDTSRGDRISVAVGSRRASGADKYAWVHEYGYGDTPARPYIRPAFRSTQAEQMKAFANAFSGLFG